MQKQVAEIQRLNHHPKWNNNYNNVDVSLYTFDKDAITTLDFDLAFAMQDCFIKEFNGG